MAGLCEGHFTALVINGRLKGEIRVGQFIEGDTYTPEWIFDQAQ